MKVIPFTIPVPPDKTVIVQEDELRHFYPHLHCHREIQITLILKGEGSLLAADHLQYFKPGDIYVIGANQPHIFKSDSAYFEKRRKLQSAALTIFFRPGELLAPLFSLPEMKPIQNWVATTSNGYKIPPEKQARVAEWMNEVKESRNAVQIAAFIRLLNGLAGIKQMKPLSAMASGRHFNESEGLRMNDIYQFSLQHFNRSISLEEIAGIAHLTAPAFCRYFKKRTRKTYIRFLNEIRIAEACKLLAQGKTETMAGIAYNTGFTNATSFNRTFKQITGMAPTEYLGKLEGTLEQR